MRSDWSDLPSHAPGCQPHSVQYSARHTHRRAHPSGQRESTEPGTTTANKHPANFRKTSQKPKVESCLMFWTWLFSLVMLRSLWTGGRNLLGDATPARPPGGLSQWASPCYSATTCHRRGIKDALVSEEVPQDCGEWATQALESGGIEKDTVAAGRRSITRSTTPRGTALWGGARWLRDTGSRAAHRVPPGPGGRSPVQGCAPCP